MLNCCNIFDLLASRTEKIAWWHLFLNLIFTYFPIMNKSGKFIVKFLLYHTYLKASQKLRNYSQIIRFFQRKMNIFIVKNFRQPLKCKLSIIYIQHLHHYFCIGIRYEPNRYLLVQSQQWKHQNNLWILFKVNNKDTKITSMTSFWFIYF